ncbi:MAG: hypothetical protein UU82_C0012G0011 [Candidatus Nomurabacteria bacterium GW2011_GWC2_41_8]|uniref:Uncharacterized protein n=3 Tax=Candidatus Nomuraibacteriota TaxID=1752729 RepID=A0A1F6YCS5_9BACT|nr:MAG: hypothetical protein UU58_C0005G0018 [Candidatus Nomurabacteria bacterium GW2011_GWA2_41_25]KKS24064.1 MAG: hypothetical protein UU82_C0012G0011 [Candidatus Nomurabacteria bacterium GW2011_GWC2_41_8]OGI67339.1 MAG: hypothetical protein A2823_00015 [Candidatus Nomurabacteria bacterium RIFCSPHIGHO2_01_FULL_41_91]OGI80624.1 MAG: hypothetical protein A3D43_00630 [Candidatus Nomurabacteria bacterium RIFCSPHIGHO2_02_FULL_41_52]OGI84898.1 MAG: hypothetical protein A3F49_00020 [Candidatus Nomur
MNDTVDLLQIRIEKAKRQLSEDTLNAIAAVPWQAAILKMRETKGYSFEQLGDLELETELLLCGLVSSQDYPKELENRMKISKAAANELVQEMNREVFSKIKEELIKKTERKKIFEKNSSLEEHPSGGDEQNPSTPSLRATPQEGNKHDTVEEKKINTQVLNSAGIEIINGNGNEKKETLPIPEKLELPAKPIIEAMAKSKGWEKPNPATNEKPAASAVSSDAPKEEMHSMLSQKFANSFQIPSVKTEHTLDNITKTNLPNPSSVKVNAPVMDPYRELPE